MTGRRPVTDPASSQPPGSWSLLAVLDEVLTASGSAVATVIGTGRKIRVRSLFPGTGYSAQTTVWVTEVLGTLRAFAIGDGAGGGGNCGCCDLTKCVDRGNVTACSLGEACRNYYSTGLDLAGAYAPDAPTSPMKFAHVSGCVWESRTFVIGNNTYLWRLTASPEPSTIELVHVDGAAPPIPPIVFQGPKPFATLCGNEFWLHRQPGSAWARGNPRFPDPDNPSIPAYFPFLPSTVCLSPEPEVGTCGVCPDGVSPRYLRVSVGPGANASGAEHCSGIAWDVLCATPIEATWDEADPIYRVACSFFGYGPCGPLDLPAQAIPGGDASGFNALPSATVSIGQDWAGNPTTVRVVVTMFWAVPSYLTCAEVWYPGYPDWPWPAADAGLEGIYLEVVFEMPTEDFDCLATNEVPFASYRQFANDAFGGQHPVIWEPGYCDFSGLTCTVEPSA